MMTAQQAAQQILTIFRQHPDTSARQLTVGTILEAYFAAVGNADQFGEGLHWLIQHGHLEQTSVGYRLTPHGRETEI